MNNITVQLYRLSKIMKGIDVPHWIDDFTLIQYPKGYRGLLQKRWMELWLQWRKEHPYDILNGGE